MSGIAYEEGDIDPIIVGDDAYPYICSTTDDDANSTTSCPYTCVGLSDCNSCGCAENYPADGPWGKAMDVIMCLLPIIL